MLKRKISLFSESIINDQLNKLLNEVSSSQLSPPTKVFLSDQLNETLLQFERQQASKAIVTANRVLEGDGYRIIINVSFGKKTFTEKIKRMVGL